MNSPKSLSFKDNEPIQSHEIGEVLYASLGNAVSGDSQWSGLNIVDPFNMPKRAIIVSIDGIDHSNISAVGKTYALHGNTVEQSLNGVITQLEADNDPVCAFTFDQFEEEKSLNNIFGDLKVPPIANTKYLNANLHTSDRQCLENIAYLNAVADNLADFQSSCKLIYLGLSFDDLVKLHGKHSEAVREAMDLTSIAIKKLNTAALKHSNNEALVVIAVNKADGNSRNKREIAPDDAKVSVLKINL